MAEAPPAADSAVGGKTPTDTTTAARERASMRSGAQQFQYQAEVNRLLDILIHSLYSNKVPGRPGLQGQKRPRAAWGRAHARAWT
jgi:hypothetical protein